MTSFSDPDLIACPYCGQLHERCLLRSFNSLWSTYFSDGGQSLAIYSIAGLISRCTQCYKIINRPSDSKSAGEVARKKVFKISFWRKVFGLQPDYEVVTLNQKPRLPYPELCDWIEASEQADIPIEQRTNYALFAMYEFNQLERQLREGETRNSNKHKDFSLINEYRDKITQIEDDILEQANKYHEQFDCLTAADIYRRRGQFELAIESLRYVHNESYLILKSFIIQWVNDEELSLMAIPFSNKRDMV